MRPAPLERCIIKVVVSTASADLGRDWAACFAALRQLCNCAFHQAREVSEWRKPWLGEQVVLVL